MNRLGTHGYADYQRQAGQRRIAIANIRAPLRRAAVRPAIRVTPSSRSSRAGPGWQTRGVTSEALPAAAAGTWKLGDMIVNRLGLGAMRLTGSAAFDLGTPSDRDQSIRVLRRAVELGVNHIDTAAFYFSPLRSANELINTRARALPGRPGHRDQSRTRP